MKSKISFKGTALTLLGRVLKERTKAPNFKVVDSDLKEITIDDLEDKIKIIMTFPSLDTPVCDLQVKEFNKRAHSLSEDVVTVAISRDLPFAQKRYCNEFTIDHVLIFSDYKYSSFGLNYGVLIKELNLLTRAVIIVDKINTIRYIHMVEEVTNQPDYDTVFNELQKVTESPSLAIDSKVAVKCIPCEGKGTALTREAVEKQLEKFTNWKLVDNKKILKEIVTNDYVSALALMNVIANIAEEQGHHPTLTLLWNKLRVTLTTHAAEGLTENDFVMASYIDEIIET